MVRGVDAAIDAVEREYDVSIFAARDFGSHAWNLAAPDSDRDVAVVFARPPTEYATLGDGVESVHAAFEGVDVSGWDVRRFGELLVDSNPTALEVLHSPLVYRPSHEFDALAADVGGRFEPIRLYHHYRSLAVENVVESPTVKRALYVLRGTLYARFVLDTHRFPPLDFPAFLDVEGERFDPALVEMAREVTARKRRGEGDSRADVDLSALVAALPAEVDPAEHAVRGISRARVNAFIRAVVGSSGEPS